MRNFLNFYYKHRLIIFIISCIIGISIISISTFVFKNDYYGTWWHWIISLITCFFMYFGYFGITDEEDNKNN